MSELLPCPFCGGKPELAMLGLVFCPDCGATIDVNNWNMRVERTCRNKSRFAPGGTRFVCSACDFGSDWDMWDDNCGVPMDFWFDYCPNCGAKVVEE